MSLEQTRHRSGAFSVASFCEAYGLSVPLFYKMRAKGEGPDIMKVGTRTLISLEAADRWRRARERTAKPRPERGSKQTS